MKPWQPTASDHRVVVAHNRGLMTGVHQILGTVSGVLKELQQTELPASFPNVDLVDHRGNIDLIAVKRSYVLYREAIVPAGARETHPAQK